MGKVCEACAGDLNCDRWGHGYGDKIIRFVLSLDPLAYSTAVIVRNMSE